jgi:hypothetical protein
MRAQLILICLTSAVLIAPTRRVDPSEGFDALRRAAKRIGVSIGSAAHGHSSPRTTIRSIARSWRGNSTR